MTKQQQNQSASFLLTSTPAVFDSSEISGPRVQMVNVILCVKRTAEYVLLAIQLMTLSNGV